MIACGLLFPMQEKEYVSLISSSQNHVQAVISKEEAQTKELVEEAKEVSAEAESIGLENKKMIQQWRDDVSALHRKDEALQVSNLSGTDSVFVSGFTSHGQNLKLHMESHFHLCILGAPSWPCRHC